MHDDFEPISAIVERLVKGLAPGQGEEAQPGAHRHAEGGGGATILEFRRRGTGATGPTWPPQPTINTVSDGGVAPSRITPATGRLGNRILRKL